MLLSERKVGDWLSIFFVRTARKKRQARIRWKDTRYKRWKEERGKWKVKKTEPSRREAARFIERIFRQKHYFTLAPWALKSSLPRWMKSCPLRKNLVVPTD